jgi:hypothetical protein
MRRAIVKHLNPDLESEILEDMGVTDEGLSEKLRELRPDMIFERSKITEKYNGGRPRRGSEVGDEARAGAATGKPEGAEDKTGRGENRRRDC